MQLIVAALFCSSVVANAEVLPLSVQDNQILIGGKPGALVGNSLFWSNTGWGGERFYNKDVVKRLKEDWKSNLIRVPVGVGEPGGLLKDSHGNKARAKTVIDAAIDKNMYVIIDWHDDHCNQHQNEAVAFFKDMAKAYRDVNNVIYEICNEPKDMKWKDSIKPYAITVIKAIRDIDKNNLIVVGTEYYSQGVDVAAADPIREGKNVGYVLHFYAGSHHQELRDKAQTALKKIPLFVTEWGTVKADGNGSVATEETNAWFAFMKANKISNANWSINDKLEGASALKPGARSDGKWSENDLTESGKFVRNLIQNWSK